jgi:hypothetical protein
MAYVKATDGTLVSFPYSDWGVYVVTENAIPDYNIRTQKVERQDPQLSGSSWVMNWSVLSKTQAEIDEYDTLMAQTNRNKRNELLLATDYHGLSDSTMSTEMASYRQALRDITGHANWPNLNPEDWPIKPE